MGSREVRARQPRPVDGYAAPQLHTHVVFFNLTETQDGETRALQPQELYRTQQYATAVYRSELAVRLKELGYEIEHGRSGQPEIKGYTREYLEASSPRSQQIQEHLEEQGLRGAGGGADRRPPDARGETAIALARGNAGQAPGDGGGFRPTAAAGDTRGAERGPQQDAGEKAQHIEAALDYSRERNMEREAVADERELMRDGLKRSMGEATFAEVNAV